MEEHKDLFTPEEAAAYLRLKSVDALKKLKSQGLLVGYDGWTTYDLYYREDLDNCVLKMTGRGHRVQGAGPKLARRA